MKKIITIIGLITLLTACSEETTKTVVVDQSGKVIEEKVESSYRLVQTGEYITVNNASDRPIYQDIKTGCKYMGYVDGLAPLYDQYGNVEGCKSVSKKEVK